MYWDAPRPRRSGSSTSAGASHLRPGRDIESASHDPSISVPALIREAEERDCQAVAEIYAHYVLMTVSTFEEIAPTAGDWAERLATMSEANLPFVVAEADDVVVGYCYASRWRPKPAYRHAGEVTIYVSPARTGQGIGGRLLEDLIRRCPGSGFTQLISVVVRTDDDASLRFHESAGFERVGVLRRVGFKHGQWLDTVLLQRGVG